MLEIIALHQGKLKSASQKLYKFCLEKEETTPEYSIRNLKTTQGFMYEAQCVALGRVGIGILKYKNVNILNQFLYIFLFSHKVNLI